MLMRMRRRGERLGKKEIGRYLHFPLAQTKKYKKEANKEKENKHNEELSIQRKGMKKGKN